jgi:hypothetical protein
VSVRLTVREPSTVEFATMGTVNVLEVSPALKVRVPDVWV